MTKQEKKYYFSSTFGKNLQKILLISFNYQRCTLTRLCHPHHLPSYSYSPSQSPSPHLRLPTSSLISFFLSCISILLQPITVFPIHFTHITQSFACLLTFQILGLAKSNVNANLFLLTMLIKDFLCVILLTIVFATEMLFCNFLS